MTSALRSTLPYVNTLQRCFLQLHIAHSRARTVPTSVWFSVSFICVIKVELQTAVVTDCRLVTLHVGYVQSNQRGNLVPRSWDEETRWSVLVWQKTKTKLVVYNVEEEEKAWFGVWIGLNELRPISRFVHFQQRWTLTLYLQRVISSVLDGFWLSLLICIGTMRNP